MPLDSQGRLPNVEFATIQLIKSKMPELGHVGTDQGPGKQRFPNVVVLRDGGLPFTDLTRIDRARIVCYTRDRTRERAILTAKSVAKVFVPTEKIIGGLYENLVYTDPETKEAVTIKFGHAREDGAPVYDPDDRGVPLVRESFMITYS